MFHNIIRQAWAFYNTCLTISMTRNNRNLSYINSSDLQKFITLLVHILVNATNDEDVRHAIAVVSFENNTGKIKHIYSSK